MIQAGSDFIIQPSRFEPCGLTQLYALRYGALPIVSRTGGLAETIIDANDAAIEAGVATGFQFEPANTDDLCAALTAPLTPIMTGNFSGDFRGRPCRLIFPGTRVPHNIWRFSRALLATASAKECGRRLQTRDFCKDKS